MTAFPAPRTTSSYIGRYTVDLDGTSARYTHGHGEPPRPGGKIHTSAGWAVVTRLVATPDTGGVGHLTAVRSTPPPAVRPLVPEY